MYHSFLIGILHRTRTNNFKICMEIQKTLNSQSNLEKEEWNWRNQPAWLQALLQSHSHQDSMVLAQRQKYRSMEQNRKPRDKSTYLWTPYLQQRRQEYTMEKDNLFNKWCQENWSTTCKRMKWNFRLPPFVCLSCVLWFRCVWLFAAPWTVAHQSPLSLEFSRQEYQVDCHFHSRRCS